MSQVRNVLHNLRYPKRNTMSYIQGWQWILMDHDPSHDNSKDLDPIEWGQVWSKRITG